MFLGIFLLGAIEVILGAIDTGFYALEIFSDIIFIIFDRARWLWRLWRLKRKCARCG